MRCLARCLFVLVLLLGFGASAWAGGTEPETSPPEHWEAIAACDIRNKELCGWWQTDPSECCDTLVYGTRWVAGENVATCEIIREGRDEVQIFSIFRCRWLFYGEEELSDDWIYMLALRPAHLNSAFHVLRDFSLSHFEDPVTDDILDCLIAQGRNFPRRIDIEQNRRCPVNWGRFERGGDFTPRE